MSWVELILRHEQCTVATVHCSNSYNACCSDLFLLARANYYIWYAIEQKKFLFYFDAWTTFSGHAVSQLPARLLNGFDWIQGSVREIGRLWTWKLGNTSRATYLNFQSCGVWIYYTKPHTNHIYISIIENLNTIFRFYYYFWGLHVAQQSEHARAMLKDSSKHISTFSSATQVTEPSSPDFSTKSRI